jgi:hypothetical protein
MAEDRKVNPTAEPVRIDIDQPAAVRDWSREFGVTEEELRAAVRAVGPMSDNVWEHLQMTSSQRSNTGS